MKKYYSRATKWLGIATLIGLIMLVVGIIFIVADLLRFEFKLAFTMCGGMMTFFLLPCFFAEASRAIIIDSYSISFPIGADRNGKPTFHRTVIPKDRIVSIRVSLKNGDWRYFDDTTFYNLMLKDATIYTVTIDAYSEKAKKEILAVIRGCIIKTALDDFVLDTDKI